MYLAKMSVDAALKKKVCEEIEGESLCVKKSDRGCTMKQTFFPVWGNAHLYYHICQVSWL